jgi:8-oxo-dGTP pyrophosphatase MutT (NUDIX family)
MIDLLLLLLSSLLLSNNLSYSYRYNVNHRTNRKHVQLHHRTIMSESTINDNHNEKQQQQQQPRITNVKEVASTRWLSLQTLTYIDQEGTERFWDVATRTTKAKNPAPPTTTTDTAAAATSPKADAVIIVPLLVQQGTDILDTLLVEQFRPPLGQTTIEFPAGLIDKDERPEDAALRELREETGYVGEKCRVVPQVSRQVCMSPGLTDETVHVVVVEVDLDNPYNHGTPQPDLDVGEFVTVKRVSLQEGVQELLNAGSSMPIQGLYMFALGLELGRRKVTK